MKKTVAILLCALLATLSAISLADNPYGDLFDLLPGEPGIETPPRGDGETTDGITLQVNGESVRLAYDPSPQYSSIRGGIVQASYYAYGQDGKALYELYISFPDTSRAGMVITPEYASMINAESSVVLIVSQDNLEKYYFSSLLDGNVYPAGSGFSISIDEVVEGIGAVSYSGTLSASLIALDMSSGEVADALEIAPVPFRFTVNGDIPDIGLDAPQATYAPDDLRRV